VENDEVTTARQPGANEVRVRRATTHGDFDRARDLMHEYYGWALAEAGYDDLIEVAPEVVDEIENLGDHYGSTPSAQLLLAAIGEAPPSGVCAVERLDATSAELKRLYVRPETRGQRMAWTLISHVAGIADEMGCSVLRLDTHQEIMRPAIALYRRFGFVESAHRCTAIDVHGMIGFELKLPIPVPA
jgi:GNAT superfamily N-acetyltransferase